MRRLWQNRRELELSLGASISVHCLSSQGCRISPRVNLLLALHPAQFCQSFDCSRNQSPPVHAGGFDILKPVAILAIMTALPIASAGRLSHLGPRGIVVLVFLCGPVLSFG